MKMPKIVNNAPVIVGFTALSFAVLMFSFATAGSSTERFFTCYRTSVADPMMYLRMFTYIFGHSGMEHYLNNFAIIILAGPMLEEKYGSKRLALMITVTAFLGGLVNVLLTESGLLGASGIAFLLIVLCSCTSVGEGKIPVTLVFVAAIYIGREVAAGVVLNDNVSQLTHILGGLCGIGFGLYYNQKPVEKPKA